MKKVKFLALCLITGIFATSCSDDEGSVTGDDFTVNLYATSNTSGDITAYKFSDVEETEIRTLITGSTDAEGIYVDDDADEVTQASRNLLQLTTYGNLDAANDGITLNLSANSASDLVSPRDIAVRGNVYVVADNSDVDGVPLSDDGRFFVYTKSGNAFTLRNVVTVNFAVWGIEFVGNDLYAVVDKTSDVALFESFVTTYTGDVTATPDKRVTIEGITRTHGIGYDDGTMILTDIGDAAVDNDGGFHIITNFESKFMAVDDGGTLAVAENQVRVSGSATFLGNPVSADYDEDSNTVYIAERANAGGRVLAFSDVGTGGNIAPTVNYSLSGASSVYFSED